MIELHDDNEGKDYARSESDTVNGDPGQADATTNPHRPRRPKCNQGPIRPHGPMGLVVPAPTLHVMCSICSAKSGKDAESHLLCNSDRMDSHERLQKKENVPGFA